MNRLDRVLDHLPSPLRQIAWFFLLWLMGVAAVSLVAYAIRAMIL